MAKEWKAIGGVGTVGLEVVLSILLGFFAGRWLDTKLHSAPYLAIVGFLFGVAAAVKAILRSSKEMREATLREEREQGNPAPLFDKPDDHPDKERQEQEDGPAPEDIDGDLQGQQQRGRNHNGQ